ncbi:MAG: hypothetical protein ACJ8G8_13295 [Pseudomonas sp.]
MTEFDGAHVWLLMAWIKAPGTTGSFNDFLIIKAAVFTQGMVPGNSRWQIEIFPSGTIASKGFRRTGNRAPHAYTSGRTYRCGFNGLGSCRLR